jgi:hypothetical protein
MNAAEFVSIKMRECSEFFIELVKKFSDEEKFYRREIDDFSSTFFDWFTKIWSKMPPKKSKNNLPKEQIRLLLHFQWSQPKRVSADNAAKNINQIYRSKTVIPISICSVRSRNSWKVEVLELLTMLEWPFRNSLA